MRALLLRLDLRRALLGLTTTAVVVGGSLAGTPAHAASAASGAAADWLEGELTNGLAHNDQYDFDDLGLSLDFFLAFHELGTKPALQDQILDAVEPHTGDYVGTGSEAYAAQLGKLLTAVQLDGRAPGSYGDGQLFARLKPLVRRKGEQAGRAVDASQFGNYTETIGQSFVVRAFALDGRLGLARRTTRFLLKQQCDAGFFRQKMKSADHTCETGRAKGQSAPYVDATALAVTALRTARAAGVEGLGDDIRQALRWLANHQGKNGSFTADKVANANSTGLAAGVLDGTRYDRAARRAAVWLSRRQATTDNAGGTPLASDLGAVAFDKAAFKEGRTDGITVGARDQWRRASAQAAVGLAALGAAG